MYIRTIIFFLLCGSILLNSHAANINESFQEANDLIIAGNFKDAKKILLDLEELNPNNYQIIKSSQGDVVGYIPMESAKTVYDIAADFQKKDISQEHAINLTQIVADNICNMLSLETSFNVLDFLREEQKDKKD